MSYPCTGCGACCRTVGRTIEKARAQLLENPENAHLREVASFPYAVDENGHCEKLNLDNTCSVYEDRPNICKVDTSYEKYWSHKMSKYKYYQANIALCNSMMDAQELDLKWRINSTI